MKQLIQNFKTGEMYVDEIPSPGRAEGMVLVENHYSLISAGTERGTVKTAQTSLIGKARERPDLVAQVISNIKKEGIAATITKVRTKLDSLKALGYSCAGSVIASYDNTGKFRPGDRVACGGQDYASHASVVAVPANLVVRIPENVTYEEAAFTTVGSIAMQGIRQARPALGEKVFVIGLGLLGQITCSLLKANGCMVMAADLSESLVNLAINSAGVAGILRNDPNILTVCENFTEGHGFDTVIITAATHSNDPVEFASAITRKKGKIIVVGSVKMDIQREPYFYKKELELIMSSSYGPGRYDPEYEEYGHDYPYAHVRWTEQRNMQAFLDLLSMRSIDIKPLISHVFDIDNAGKAYDIVTGKNKEFYTGILLKYAGNNENAKTVFEINKPVLSKVSAGFIGAGSFAQSYLIPNVKSHGGWLAGVVTARGITSKNVADKFNFGFCSTEPGDIFGDFTINTVFIATPHSSHSELAVKALESGKNVFVEKPLAINMEQLNAVMEAKRKYKMILMTGFNRRFAPVSRSILHEFESINEPMLINIRVNAGMIPKGHWIQNPEIGGGRIIGEACHFVDLMQYFTGSEPVNVFAESLRTNNSAMTPFDNVAITLRFRNGSLGNLVYQANGDRGVPKERIEISSGGTMAVIDDFKKGYFFRNGTSTKLTSDGKGHREEVRLFLDAVINGNDSPIEFRSICLTTLTTFKILESLYTGQPQEINL